MSTDAQVKAALDAWNKTMFVAGTTHSDAMRAALAAAQAAGAERSRILNARSAADPAPAGTLPICTITGRIAGDSDACGDCDPCGAAHAVPSAVKRLLSEKDDWRNKYADVRSLLETAPAGAPSETGEGELTTVIYKHLNNPSGALTYGRAQEIARSVLALFQQSDKK